MSEKTPPPEAAIRAESNRQLVEAVADLMVKFGEDRATALMRIAENIEEYRQERKQLALERGLPENATWDDIIAYDERQGKN